MVVHYDVASVLEHNSQQYKSHIRAYGENVLYIVFMPLFFVLHFP